MKEITESDYPLVVDDRTALLELSMDGGFERRFYQIGAKEHLDLEKLVRKALKEIYSGYAIRRLAIERSMGGSNHAAIRTMDHIDCAKFHTPQHLARLLDESVVCWTSGDFYFDIED
jgi:hypothetical protein